VWRIFVFAETHTQWPQKREFIGINFGNPYYWIIFIYYNGEDVVMSTVVSEKKIVSMLFVRFVQRLTFR
jgi:hypothetical protein